MSEFYGHMTMADGSHVPLSKEQAEEIWHSIEVEKAETERLMPDQKAALKMLSRAYHRLMDFGWKEAIYCPKDGRLFQAIEAGSTGIHSARYEGKWPDGHWWIFADGDMYPSRPILFRLNPEINQPLPPIPQEPV